MPKTRGAYWLENFDEKKILQRRFFKRFNLPQLSDIEILETLKVRDEDSVQVMEQKLSKVKALHDQAQKFEKMAIRYFNRKSKVGGVVYIDEISARNEVVSLIIGLRKIYYDNEKRIQQKYREDVIGRLKYFQSKSGITRKKLGEMVQVSPQSMYDYWHQRRDVPLHTLIRLAKVLKISGDELLGLR